ncbi:nucleotidyltransferase domain-containing protein [Alkaliphilus pronyensis]|uniref:nucleotidyltransferase domain-containing protein n=1 Tax=Alkaliphilus pronyensis TaxID=1482732 RepID=UPI001FA97D26|nr:nucleotidyltransferase domain-containing protein [Alkaliphilus pronyensis]
MKDYVIEQIIKVANKYKIDKIILFGSRAKGENTNTSDYDLAVFCHQLSPTEKALFCCDLEEINTLKKIDVVFIDDNIDEKLMENILTEGVVIYG